MTDDRKSNLDDLNLSTPEKVHEFALSVESAGRQAVQEAIAGHRAIGNPIYFGDPQDPDLLIKEMPDGRRFRVRFADDGTETA